MKKFLLAMAAAVMVIGLSACGTAEDDGKISQPHCEPGDTTCVELPTDG